MRIDRTYSQEELDEIRNKLVEGLDEYLYESTDNLAQHIIRYVPEYDVDFCAGDYSFEIEKLNKSLIKKFHEASEILATMLMDNAKMFLE